MTAGEFDAVVLAEAGLRRLGRTGAADHRFSVGEIVPAPGQGALALEAVRGSEAAEVLRSLDHAETREAVCAERSVLERTGAGCRSALGALGQTHDSETRLTGFVEDDRGPRRASVTGADRSAAVSGLIEALAL